MSLVFCENCVMDGTAPELVLDEGGVCNFCHSAQKSLKEIGVEKLNLKKIVDKIKNDGKHKPYNCLIGLSGGVDSSTALVEVVKLGLRPLAFSMDNGWNDPKADENIMRLVETLKVPFYRYVIDLEKFRELQSAFIRGGAKNLEAITDHILFATTYEMASKYKIKWIISGGNVATESIMPASWGEDPRDLHWIKSVYKTMTGKKLKGLPTISLVKEQYYRLVKGIKFFQILNYFDYNRQEAITKLEEKFGYKSYGDKHCENIFTMWFQNFYLFEKFGIDKRKAHYSSLINSGQMTRKEAMDLLAECPEYPRFGMEDKILRYPQRSFPDSRKIRGLVVKLYGCVRRFSNFSSQST